ncbi:MAG: hypothetical protein WB492_02950 [Christiangramia sp.]
MIISKLKSIIYSKKIRKALKNKAGQGAGNTGKVGLIIDAKDLDQKLKLANLKEVAGFSNEKIQVVVCGEPKDMPQDLNAEILEKKDVSLSGEFNKEAIRKFTEERFDFIIGHFSDQSILGELLVAKSNAIFKIGNKPDDFGIYDVEIDAQEIGVFQQELIKYLKILKRE